MILQIFNKEKGKQLSNYTFVVRGNSNEIFIIS